MIITKLIGGLGNQMFQYSVGRRLAYDNNTDLKLDITGYKNQEGITPRKYELSVFNIDENFATKDEITKLKTQDRFINIKYLRKISRALLTSKNPAHILQRENSFNPLILKLTDNIYLDGFWTSEKYFKDIENIIRKDFTFKKLLEAKNKKMAEKIDNSDPVSIHFRRDDYVTVKYTHDYHGVCEMDYYRQAVEIIAKNTKNPHFYVFSDDPGWVKNNFKIKYPVEFIDWNTGDKSYEDMRLMSLCKHNIIANSSFSWWGAWLNNNPNKIVIAPKKWFTDPSIDTSDLIPEGWMRI